MTKPLTSSAELDGASMFFGAFTHWLFIGLFCLFGISFWWSVLISTVVLFFIAALPEGEGNISPASADLSPSSSDQ